MGHALISLSFFDEKNPKFGMPRSYCSYLLRHFGLGGINVAIRKSRVLVAIATIRPVPTVPT